MVLPPIRHSRHRHGGRIRHPRNFATRACDGRRCTDCSHRFRTLGRHDSRLLRYGMHCNRNRTRPFADCRALRAAGVRLQACRQRTGKPPILKAVARIERHPQFDMQRLLGHLATADVALIKLTEPLPAQIPLARIGGETESDQGWRYARGCRLWCDRARRWSDRRHGPRRITDRHRATGIAADQAVRSDHQRTERRVGCLRWGFGGSGFCRLWQSVRVIGVVSWSTGPNLTAGCGGLTGITPLVRYRGWIVDTARKLGTPLAP